MDRIHPMQRAIEKLNKGEPLLLHVGNRLLFTPVEFVEDGLYRGVAVVSDGRESDDDALLDLTMHETYIAVEHIAMVTTRPLSPAPPEEIAAMKEFLASKEAGPRAFRFNQPQQQDGALTPEDLEELGIR